MSSATKAAAVCEYFLPQSVTEALELASRYRGEYEYYAGGTDAQALRQIGLVRKPVVIDLSGINELRAVRLEGKGLEIGSLVTLDALGKNTTYPMIAEAALSVATPVIRKTATVGGNLLVANRCMYFNQSARWRTAAGSCLRDTGDTCLVTKVRDGKCFSRNVSDMATALIALNAEVSIQNRQGQFSLPLQELYVQDGLASRRHLEDDAILTKICVHTDVKAGWYRKLRLRRSLDFTSLTVAACLNASGGMRICLNGISMAPVVIGGRLADLSLAEIMKQARSRSKIVDNDALPFEHRKEMIAVYLEDLWQALRES